MTKNMGILDRGIRTVLGLLFILLYALETVSGTWGVVLLVVGIVFLLTSFVSFCPLYKPFKLSTRKKSS